MRTYVVKPHEGNQVGEQEAAAVVIRDDHATFFGIPGGGEKSITLGPGWYIHESQVARSQNLDQKLLLIKELSAEERQRWEDARVIGGETYTEVFNELHAAQQARLEAAKPRIILI